jgi:Spy/CpxP family protein refolding chaperone
VKGRLGLALIALLAAASAGAAQDAGRAGAEPGQHRGRHEEAFRMVDAYVISHLQESLGLSDEQYVKVLPLVTRLQQERREYFLGRGHLVREMRRLLRRGGASESQVLAKLEELKKLEREGPVGIASAMQALDGALTPLQQAKYRLLELEVEQRMRELMGRAHPRGARGRN